MSTPAVLLFLERFSSAIVRSRGRLFWLFAGIGACICAVAVVVDSIHLTVHFFQPLFIWDSWATVDGFKSFKEGTYTLSDLFSQHNEHRLAVPRLVFFADFVVGRGLNIVNIVAIYLIQVVHAGVLVAMASRVSRGAIRTVISAAVVVLLFSFGQSENLTSGFQVQFVGVYAAATVACIAAAVAMQPGAAPRQSIGAMACAVVAATVATYMMSNGMLVALVMVGLAVAMRARLALLATTLVFAAAILSAYMHGGHFGGGSPPLAVSLPQRALAVAAYFLVYVGGLAGSFGFAAAGSLGLCGVLLGLVAAIRLVCGWDTGAVRPGLVGIMVFVLGTAALTAWGRVGFGLAQALESRYMTPSAVFWSALVVYWGSFVCLAAGRLPQALLIVLAGTTVVCAVGRHLAQRPTAQWNFMDANLGTDALLSGVFAPQAVKQVYPDAPTLERLVPFLAREKLNVFAWPEAGWHGKRLADVFPVIDDRRCSVVLDKRTRLDPAGDVAVEGWAWDKLRRKPVARIVLVGRDGTIVGLGSGGWFRPDFRTLPKVEHAEPGWKGYAASIDSGEIRPYAILDGGRVACGGQ